MLISWLSTQCRYYFGQRTCDHLEETGTGRGELVEADCGRKHPVQCTEYKRDDDQDGERPPGHTRVAGIVGSLRDTVCTEQYSKVPPAWNGLVRLHLLIVLENLQR